jgi:hypothetical protein
MDVGGDRHGKGGGKGFSVLLERRFPQSGAASQRGSQILYARRLRAVLQVARGVYIKAEAVARGPAAAWR